ncbi:hypothetical protein [Prevotella sp.]|uniref:hypothetical protein n=1 Tax=Prevotella sp. TaxID=59823 RepID=UPI002649BE9F|nr:hypothetical protein [Prevotella sp.]MDN5553991.1 hypothetical protein [Prevotella sp.]
MMNIDNKNTNLLGVTLIILCVLSSCIPIIDSRVDAIFKNCTNDTLFIGASHYDNVDSVEFLVNPNYNILANSDLDTTDISLWKGTFARGDSFVYPGSICAINANYLFQDKDTCYFFLIKLGNAKRYSWDEIRAHKIFSRWIVTKNTAGKLDKNIRYLNSVEH